MINVIRKMRYTAPCGTLVLGSIGDCLCMCDWEVIPHHGSILRRLSRLLRARFDEGPSDVIALAVGQLDEYFDGRRKEFDLPVLMAGTDFQQTVWRGLVEIPYGETLSYGQFACRIGHPAAVRALGSANGANAMSVILPCHRIIGSNNTLGGYGGGLSAKRYLLALEQKWSAEYSGLHE